MNQIFEKNKLENIWFFNEIKFKNLIFVYY
jgi:hypothetical protein